MPLPLILGAAAAVAGVAGVGTAVHGAAKMKGANDAMKDAQARYDASMKKFEQQSKTTNQTMDAIGTAELEILHSFSEFSDMIEKIQNRPEFQKYDQDGIELPQYDPEKLKEISVGAGVLLGGLGGAALGTAGGFAAAGATTAAVMALGTASTGTAIASLSGIAATNATLAALGGGAIAAGGGGMALGTTILGATTLGMALLVGGLIFNFTGLKLSSKAQEAQAQSKKAEAQSSKICGYLATLNNEGIRFKNSLDQVNKVYREHLFGLNTIVNMLGKEDWNEFTPQEKRVTENSVLLVGLLYKMCQVKLVLKNEGNGLNMVNTPEMHDVIHDADNVLQNLKA